MREQFEKLVIELVENDIIEHQNAGEMLTTLMESVPTNSEIDTKVLIESLKKEFTVNAAILDSNNGINKDIVKTITEEKVKVEKEKVEKNKEQEAKREAQNSKSVEESLGIDENEKENEKNNIEEKTEDYDFDYEITPELKDIVDKYFAELGLNIIPTKEVQQDAAHAMKVYGLTPEQSVEVANNRFMGENLFSLIEKHVRASMSFEDAKALAYQEIGINEENIDQVQKAEDALITETAANMMREFSGRLREINKAGNSFIDIEKLNHEEFINEYFNMHPFNAEMMAKVTQLFESQIAGIIEEKTANDGRETKQQVYNWNKIKNFSEPKNSNKYRDARIGIGKDFYNLFGYRFAKIFGGSDAQVVEDYRDEISVYQKDLLDAYDFLDTKVQIKNISFDDYKKNLDKIHSIRSSIFHDREHIKRAVSRNNDASFSLTEQMEQKNRDIIAQEIVKDYFSRGNVSLSELYDDAGEIAIKSGLTLDDLIAKAQEYSDDVGIGKNIGKLEHKIDSLRRDYKAAGYVLSAILGKDIGVINAMSPEEIARIKKDIRDPEKISILEEMLLKREQLRGDIDNEKSILRLNNKEIRVTDKKQNVIENSDKEKKYPDYVGVIDDAQANRTLEERTAFMNDMINDRNKILLNQKKYGLTIEEAAKQYFKDNDSALNKYSNKFEEILNGDNSNQKFTIDIIENVIMYQNSKLINQLEAQIQEINYKTDIDKIKGLSFEEVTDLLMKKNDLKNQRRVSNALKRMIVDDKDPKNEPRKKDVDELVDYYMNAGGSVYYRINDDYERDSKSVKDIDENEILSRVQKRIEKLVPGLGKQLVEGEKKVIELEIKMQACKLKMIELDNNKTRDEYNKYEETLKQYEDEKKSYISKTQAIRVEYKSKLNPEQERPLEEASQMEKPQEKKGFFGLNIQSFITAKRVSEKAILEQHSEIKNAIELSEQQNTRAVNGVNQNSMQEQDERN